MGMATVVDRAVAEYKRTHPEEDDQLQRVIPGVDPWPVDGDVTATTTSTQFPSNLTSGGNFATAIEEFGPTVPMARLAEEQLIELRMQTVEIQLSRERHSSQRMGIEMR